MKNFKTFLTMFLKSGSKKIIKEDTLRWIQIRCKAFIVKLVCFGMCRNVQGLHGEFNTDPEKKGNAEFLQVQELLSSFVGKDMSTEGEHDARVVFSEMEERLAVAFIVKMLERCSKPEDFSESDESNWYNGKGLHLKKKGRGGGGKAVGKMAAKKKGENVTGKVDIKDMAKRVAHLEKFEQRATTALEKLAETNHTVVFPFFDVRIFENLLCCACFCKKSKVASFLCLQKAINEIDLYRENHIGEEVAPTEMTIALLGGFDQVEARRGGKKGNDGDEAIAGKEVPGEKNEGLSHKDDMDSSGDATKRRDGTKKKQL